MQYFQIIWDGQSIAAMANLLFGTSAQWHTKKSLEALDQYLKDLRGDSKPFGSTLILLAGDFRQLLPIIPRSTPADEMNACLKNSNLWAHVKTLKINYKYACPIAK